MRVGDALVAFADEGPRDGSPVVLVHGTTQDRTAWVFVAPALHAAGLRTIAVELPGSGATTDSGGPLDLTELAAQTLAVASHLGVGRFHLVGYSLGAEVAAVVAATAPDAVAGAALVCGWLRSDEWMHAAFDVWARLAATDAEMFARFLVVEAFSPTFHTQLGGALELGATSTATTLAPGSGRQAELDGRVDLSDLAPKIAVPVVVVGAELDRIVPMPYVRELAGAIPGATLTVVPGGHAVPIEQPGELAAIIIALVG